MANMKQQIKRYKNADKKRAINTSYKTALKTAIKNVLAAVEAGNKEAAVAAYNAGFVVGDWLKDPNYSSDGKNLDKIPYGETEQYVKKVMNTKKMYKKLYFSEK